MLWSLEASGEASGFQLVIQARQEAGGLRDNSWPCLGEGGRGSWGSRRTAGGGGQLEGSSCSGLHKATSKLAQSRKEKERKPFYQTPVDLVVRCEEDVDSHLGS